ncbi:MAG: FKBP-type peptidyl-prolyl cis-trans isomerase [Planctomycetes bacterium]|nr:FKBP-type peptidyl-prolyl cis-trans isomerase [Planctomycetota bacterium]
MSPRQRADVPAEEQQWVTTTSGLSYLDVIVGDGKQVESGDMITVRYVMCLDNWTVVDATDSSLKGKVLDDPENFEFGSEPTASFPLDALIKAWQEGVPGMNVGGVRRMVIPPALGYGARVTGPIPANSTLFCYVQIAETSRR